MVLQTSPMLRLIHLSFSCLIAVMMLFTSSLLAAEQQPAESTANNILTVSAESFAELAYHPLKKSPAYVVVLQNSLLSAQLAALVEKILVKTGDRASKGETLVVLECDEYLWQAQQLDAEKEALSANYDFTRYQFKRSKKLLKTSSVSEESHRNLEAELKNLRAKIHSIEVQLKNAQKNIQRCEIKAPFDGVVAERQVNIGESVSPGTPLLRLINTEELEVEVQVPVSMINQLDYKTLDFVYQEEQYPLRLRAVIPSIETRARHQLVRLEFKDKKALPNAFGMVHVSLNYLNIPASVLVQRGGQTGIFIAKPVQTADEVDSQKVSHNPSKNHYNAVFHPIENALIGRPVRLELAPDTLIVSEGRHALKHGQQLMIKNKAQQAR